MNVIKRTGELEKVNLNKITARLNAAIKQSPSLSLDPIIIAQKVVNGLYDGVTTIELDKLASETAAYMGSIHPDYDALASRLVVSNMHKEIPFTFSEVTEQLYKIGILNKEYYDYIITHSSDINDLIDHSRDYLFDYFGIQTLRKSYLLKDKEGNILERPQHLWLRVATFLHMSRGTEDNQKSLELIKETYDLLSQKYFTHATPTLFNAGTIKPQLSSCFLLDIDSDSIGGIYKTLSDCAKISQSAGGIGLAAHKIRSKGSYINGTNGTSNGIVPMLRVFDATARYVDQGGGRRKGSFAIYLEPWHADIFDFLQLKKNTGEERLRARDLFYAMWIPDLFMERVERDEEWTLFDPAKAYVLDDKGNRKYLYETYGASFNEIYKYLEDSKLGERTIKARDLWNEIMVSQIETGTPYILYKDAANSKSNQSNLGTIKSSNLCTEIIEYTSPSEIAVCNLASLSLPAFVVKNEIDYKSLYEVSRTVTRNLNKLIDISYYPVKEGATSNITHRPIGIGVQGLADLYAILKLPFDGEQAKEINKRIFEVIYKGAIDESIQLAKEQGSYSSYKGSPTSKGQLQFDLWNIDRAKLSCDWSETFKNLNIYGLRNSLLLAPMPTASTSQILGNNECFEPYTSNIYTRRTLAGEFIVTNKYLVRELIDLGLWSETIRQKLIAGNGSVQQISEIPEEIRHRYRTVWEMKMKDIIEMSADRGPFICQSQSLNLFVTNATTAKLTSMHFHGWKLGLKTSSYYIRTQAAVDAIQFTLNKDLLNEEIRKEQKEEISHSITGETCSIEDPNCEACGS